MRDEEQFSAAMVRYRDTVFRVAYTYLRDAADADDVTQDVFIKLYRTATCFESDEHLRRWLIHVAINTCKSLFRTPWRRVRTSNLTPISWLCPRASTAASLWM